MYVMCTHVLILQNNIILYDYFLIFRKFIAEKLPPLQYKNPDVQVVLFKNKHSFPAIRIYFDDGRKMMLAVEGKPPDRIMEELSAVAAKTE